MLLAERQKIKNGETALLKLKDWPSGEDFKAMMPARYESFISSQPPCWFFALYLMTQSQLHYSFSFLLLRSSFLLQI